MEVSHWGFASKIACVCATGKGGAETTVFADPLNLHDQRAWRWME